MTRMLRMLALSIAAIASLPAAAVPAFTEVKAAYRPSDVVLLDRHAVPIQTVRIDKTVRRLPWVPLSDISPALLHALVLSEDRNFYEHSGIDWGALARSACRTFCVTLRPPSGRARSSSSNPASCIVSVEAPRVRVFQALLHALRASALQSIPECS